MRAALAMAPAMVPFVFGDDGLARLRELVEIDTAVVMTSADDLGPDERASVELLITGWGAPWLGKEVLETLPALRAIVHWGGGVGFLDEAAAVRGIAVSTARVVNALPVAEFTMAMITLAAKDAFWVSRRYCAEQRYIDREAALPHTGLVGSVVGIVGASTIGTLVVELLADRGVEVLVYDPYLGSEHAAAMGVELVGTVESLARRSQILSIHAPATPETDGMISREVLAALPDGATVINTARGSLVDQESLVAELEAGRLRAILDVTEPEVLPAGHPLYSLPNVFLTPHIAGSTGRELRRLGRSALDEVARLVAGEPFEHPFHV